MFSVIDSSYLSREDFFNLERNFVEAVEFLSSPPPEEEVYEDRSGCLILSGVAKGEVGGVGERHIKLWC